MAACTAEKIYGFLQWRRRLDISHRIHSLEDVLDDDQ
jgi:hypothetical protein